VARRPSPAGRSDRSAGRRLRCAGRTHRTSDQRPCPPQLVIRRASTCRGNPCLDGNNAAGPRITRQRRAPPRRPPPGDLSRPPVHVGRSMNTLNSVGSASDATGTSLTSLGVGFSRWARTTGCTMAKSEATQAGILDPPQRARNTATVSPNPRIERSLSWRKPRSASRSTGSAIAARPKKCGNFGRQARYRSCCGGGAPRGNERKQ
jgi:hypothetical protein